MPNKFKDFIYLMLYKFAKFIFTYTPKRLQKSSMDALAWLFYTFDKKHTKIVTTNLDLVFENQLTLEQKESMTLKIFRNFAYFGADFIRNQNLTREDILNKVTFKNEEIFLETLKLNRPIIITTAHYGNWELLSIALAAKFGSACVVGRNIDSGAIDEIVSVNRSRFQLELIPKNGAAKGIISALRSGKIVGVLVDQNTSAKEGIEVEFFGKKALHTHAISIFAQKLNAVIQPAFIRRVGNDKEEIFFMEPIFIEKFEKNEAILKATQAQASATELAIRQKPDEYFWFHKRFKHFYKDKYET